MAADHDDNRAPERHRGTRTRKNQPDFNEVEQMDSNGYSDEAMIALRLGQILLELARREDDIAHAEAAAVPYWEPLPTSVVGRRAAASCLRFEADRVLQAS
jgi:hypothetical protein